MSARDREQTKRLDRKPEANRGSDRIRERLPRRGIDARDVRAAIAWARSGRHYEE